MSRRAERERAQWIRIGDQVRFVPPGKLPEELGIDMRMAIELPRAPHPFERSIGTKGRFWTDKKAEAASEHEGARRRGEWHRQVESRLADAEQQLAEMKTRLREIEGLSDA